MAAAVVADIKVTWAQVGSDASHEFLCASDTRVGVLKQQIGRHINAGLSSFRLYRGNKYVSNGAVLSDGDVIQVRSVVPQKHGNDTAAYKRELRTRKNNRAGIAVEAQRGRSGSRSRSRGRSVAGTHRNRSDSRSASRCSSAAETCRGGSDSRSASRESVGAETQPSPSMSLERQLRKKAKTQLKVLERTVFCYSVCCRGLPKSEVSRVLSFIKKTKGQLDRKGNQSTDLQRQNKNIEDMIESVQFTFDASFYGQEYRSPRTCRGWCSGVCFGLA